MTNRFSDPLVIRPDDQSPQHAWTLLRELGLDEAPHAGQVAGVQAWLDEGHAVSELLRLSLSQRDLPAQARRAA